MGSALSDYDAPNGCAAIGTGLACSAVDAMQLLKSAALSSAVDVVGDRRTPVFDREIKYLR